MESIDLVDYSLPKEGTIIPGTPAMITLQIEANKGIRTARRARQAAIDCIKEALKHLVQANHAIQYANQHNQVCAILDPSNEYGTHPQVDLIQTADFLNIPTDAALTEETNEDRFKEHPETKLE